MSSGPVVSVVLPAYNGVRWLRPQLDSILAELSADDELVVVDDASTDDTLALLRSFADPRIRLLPSPANRGVRASVERGLAACRGRYVFLADQDDVWLPGKRAALLSALQAGAVLAISDAEVIDGNGASVQPSFMATRGGFRGSLLATLIKNRYLGCAMAFRRELLEDVLPIPAAVPMHDMWIGALATLRGPVAYIDRPLLQYRRHGSNVSPGQRAGLAQMLRWRWQLLSNVLARRLRGPRPFTLEACD